MTTEASKSDSLTAFTQIRVGGVEIPFLGLEQMQGEPLASFTTWSKHADLLPINSPVEIRFNGDPVFTGQLLDRVPGGNTIICRAASSVVTAGSPLWEQYLAQTCAEKWRESPEVHQRLGGCAKCNSNDAAHALP